MGDFALPTEAEYQQYVAANQSSGHYTFEQLVAFEKGLEYLSTFPPKEAKQIWEKEYKNFRGLTFNTIESDYLLGTRRKWSFSRLPNGGLQAYLKGQKYVPVDKLREVVVSTICSLQKQVPHETLTRTKVKNAMRKSGLVFLDKYFQVAFSRIRCQAKSSDEPPRNKQ